MRVVAIALLKLRDGRYVFQRKTMDAPRQAGKLCLFGGHVEDEEPQTAIIREIREETSLDPVALNLKFRHLVLYADAAYFYYDGQVSSLDFEVYEGEPLAEAYTLEEMRQRDDVASFLKEVLNDRQF